MYVALAYIGKVYGLIPHASTGCCPYELIKKGKLNPRASPKAIEDATSMHLLIASFLPFRLPLPFAAPKVWSENGEITL